LSTCLPQRVILHLVNIGLLNSSFDKQCIGSTMQPVRFVSTQQSPGG